MNIHVEWTLRTNRIVYTVFRRIKCICKALFLEIIHLNNMWCLPRESTKALRKDGCETIFVPGGLIYLVPADETTLVGS